MWGLQALQEFMGEEFVEEEPMITLVQLGAYIKGSLFLDARPGLTQEDGHRGHTNSGHVAVREREANH
jgi:hypothetical protein